MSASAREPIAIVGIGCRFPGQVDSASSFWALLIEGRSGLREVPPDRWNAARFYHPDRAIPGKLITSRGGFLDHADRFDAEFFGISPREARRMDPQQRWLLEVAWETLEDAGIAPRRLRGSRTGVFVGISAFEFATLQYGDVRGADVHTNSGIALSIAANRISYQFDFRGPSLAVDTACSSALVALHLACESIWSGESEMALAGGVNAILTPNGTIAFSKAGMLSPDGECYAFDSRANGFVRGEGAGLIFIKPLSRAVANRDRVYAVIRATASNQDGHTAGMTVPNGESQEALLREVYGKAGIAPADVSYVEAHGTGTPVGDPIEAAALGGVLSRGRPASAPCRIGSVKTNLGHLEPAAGIAGVIKAALVLDRGIIPPNRNFASANPSVPLDDLKLRVVTQAEPLTANGHKPIVGVNSFGFGGANAHAALEPGPPRAEQSQMEAPPAVRPLALPLSARDGNALRALARNYRRFLAYGSAPIRDICCSAGARREHHPHRLVVLGQDAAALRDSLGAWLTSPTDGPGIVTGEGVESEPRITFVYSGQGGQNWRMGRDLMEREPIFRGAIEEIDALLRELGGCALLDEMLRSEAESNIDRTDVTQPALFALQVGLTRLWRSWGIVPDQVVGHSVGEVAAALAAGVLDLQDAVRVIHHRSRLQHRTGGDGGMAAAALSEETARSIIRDSGPGLEIAAINSPSLMTLAGAIQPLERAIGALDAQGVFVRRLPINYAFHTSQMDPIREELLASLADIRPRSGDIPFVSTVTGGVVAGPEMGADYWWDNVRNTVRFAQAIQTCAAKPSNIYLELGPHPSLSSSVTETLSAARSAASVIGSLRRDTDDSVEILTALARLHLAGAAIDWAAVNQSDGHYTQLPSYPWNWKSWWFESPDSARKRLEPEVTPLLGVPIAAALPTWQSEPDPRRFDYLQDHCIWNSIVFPAAGFAEMALSLAQRLHPDGSHVVEDLEIEKALFIREDSATLLQTVYNASDHCFSIFSGDEAGKHWERHVTGRMTRLPKAERQPVSIEDVLAQLDGPAESEVFYRDFDAAGYQFGSQFRNIRRIWSGQDQAIAEIGTLDSDGAMHPDACFHPPLLDACLQACVGSRPRDGSAQRLFLPARIQRIQLHVPNVPDRLWAHVMDVRWQASSVTADIRVFDDKGNPVADILGFRADRFEEARSSDGLPVALYQYRWRPGHLRGSRGEGPACLASAAAIAKAARARAGEVYERHGTARYLHDYTPRSEQFVCACIESAYRELGWNPVPGAAFTLDDAMQGLGAIERFRGLVGNQIATLARLTDAVTRQDGEEGWTVNRNWAVRDVRAIAEELRLAHPEFEAETNIVAAMGVRLADALCGLVDPLEVLFPAGSSELVGALYKRGADCPAYNDLLQAAIAGAIEQVPARRAIRILEVGAGTGSLTRAILPVLPPHRTEYTFTDFGAPFIVSARQQFTEFPFVDYRTYDVERGPEEQGVQRASFDIVVASNVIHATASVADTLDRLKECLAPGGLLIFNELSPGRAAIENVFGLLDGWWLFRDHRRNSPLLPSAEWQRLLLQLGFDDVACCVNAERGEDAVQSLQIARLPDAVPATNGVGDSPESLLAASWQSDRNASVLIFADDAGVAAGVADALHAQGMRSHLVWARGSVASDTNGASSIDSASEEALAALFDTFDRADGPPALILDCWSLDAPPGSAPGDGAAQMIAAQTRGVHHVRRVLRALARRWDNAPCKLAVVTRGAQSVADREPVDRLDSAPVQGLLRVARNEFPETSCVLIDLDPAPGQSEIEDLAAELLLFDNESEVAYRHGRRYVHRLHRIDVAELPAQLTPARGETGSLTPYRLEFGKAGALSNLSLNRTERRLPGPDEVEVEVKAAGINFRDLMKVLGMYPGNSPDLRWLGDDFAGVVTRIGENITHVGVGDEVYGGTHSCFASHAIAHRHLVTRKPKAISFAEAATIPTVFLTAHYALVTLARMRPGERVLIHAGAGGVGQAAIQVARSLDLEIFATAGTPERRELVRELGASHVMDSRSLKFADDVMALTAGEGVDAVLNSLSGDFIPKSLSVLAPFGRMLEIGKIDIYANHKLGLGPFRNNISFFAIDLDQYMRTRPEEAACLFQEVDEQFARGIYTPLSPRIFPVTEASEALRFMAQGKHVGKIVLDFDAHPIPVAPATGETAIFNPDAFYLITGGASGVGLEMARWMTRAGARHIALLSRSGPRDRAAAEIVDEMRDSGVQVLDLRGDVTNMDDVRRAVAEASPPGVPLRGIFHGAMVIHDAFITELDEEQFNSAFHPKFVGAWNLHCATRDMTLDHFVCFSSISATAGSARQSNYDAGNCFLTALTAHRRASGLPALTIEWDVIRGAGFVERDERLVQYLERAGMQGIAIAEMLEQLRFLLTRDTPGVAVARMDWAKLGRINPHVQKGKIFELISTSRAGRGGAWAKDELANAANYSEARDILIEYLAGQVAEVLGADAPAIDIGKPLNQLGLDSLMAVELVHRVEADLDRTLPMGSILGGASLKDIAESVLRMIRDDTDGGEAGDDAGIDPALESRMRDDCQIADAISFPRQTGRHDGRDSILLTGATGFLGAFVLAELLNRSDREIACIVRADDAASAFDRITGNLAKYRLTIDGGLLRERVRAIPGDLAKPHFGLTEAEFLALAAGVGGVYHLAAEVDHQVDYASVRADNVLAVRHMLEFVSSGEGAMEVHHASTLAIFSKLDRDKSEAVDEFSLSSDISGMPGGYIQTKWVAEQMFHGARGRGCPVTIYRLGLLTGDEGTGTSNPDDFLWRLVKTSVSLGKAPVSPTPLCFTPVDFAARALVALSLGEDGAHQTFHIVGDMGVSLEDFLIVAETMGHDVERLSSEEWIELISRRLGDTSLEALAPYLLAYTGHEVGRMLDPIAFPAISTAFTDRRLAEAGIAGTAASSVLIAKYLSYLTGIGFLRPPGSRERSGRLRRGGLSAGEDRRFDEPHPHV